MAEHSGFQKLVAEAKKHITEISPRDVAAKLNSGDAVVVVSAIKTNGMEDTFPARLT